MKTLGVLALVAVVLAGCSGTDHPTTSAPATHTCKDGKVIDVSNAPGHDQPGFDAEALCPKPVLPFVSLDLAGYNATVYRPLNLTWTLSNGTYHGAHSVFTSVRMSHHPVDVDQLTKMEDYGVELAQMQHHDVPFAATGVAEGTKFTAPGTYYLRAFAKIYADGIPETDHWSSQVKIVIAPVQATGTTVTVTHEAGSGQGALTPNPAAAKLGDLLVIDNKDLVDHKFTLAQQPKDAKLGDITAKAQTPSDAVFLNVPGTYAWTSDDLPTARTLQVTVSV